MLEILDRIVADEGSTEDLELLESLSDTISSHGSVRPGQERLQAGAEHAALLPRTSTWRHVVRPALSRSCNGRKRHLEINRPELCKGCGKCARELSRGRHLRSDPACRMSSTDPSASTAAPAWGACPFGPLMPSRRRVKTMAKGIMIIDGIRVPFDGEKNVLAVVRKAGIDIPTFCYYSDLSIYGACRMCMVEDTKTGKI